MNIILWRILFGWQKVSVNSYDLKGNILNRTKITKWDKLNFDYHNSQTHRKDWIWWDYTQYSKEIKV